MSTIFSAPKTGKISGSFKPFYPVSPNQGYSYVQDGSQMTAEGLYRETTVGKLMVDALTRYVVGKGLTPMSAPETDFLAWDEERLAKFRKQSEAFWRITTGTNHFDYYGKDNFLQLQQMGFRCAIKDGDVLRHVGYRKLKNGDVVPYVQLISGRMVSQEWQEDTMESVGGVIIDKTTGKEVGYSLRVLDNNFNETGTVKRVNRFTSRGRLEFDLIALGKTDPSMVRGVPILTALRDDILNYNAYKNNHVLQSALQAIFTVFIKHEPGTKDKGTTSFMDKLTGNGAEESRDGGETRYDLGPGYVVDLEDGEDPVIAQPLAHGDDFDKFSKAVIGNIASALGMSYEVAMNSYNASFSASRASISGAEKNFAILREEFADKFCTPVWDEVITYGILTGDIECPEWDGLTRTQRNALLAVTWTGVTPPQVDPTKEVNAYVEAINAGLCTKEYAIRMLFGMDYEEVAERLKAEQKLSPQNEETPDDDTDLEDDTEDDSDVDTEEA